tara:strand:+ start:195 stop:560 length:366 start_codon:yes stop_codon:yes gene_type:complete
MNRNCVIASILLSQSILAPAFSQMQEEHFQPQSFENCEFFRRPIANSKVCVNATGGVSDSRGFNVGRINQPSTREHAATGYPYVNEWVYEGFKLVRYQCDSDFYGHCKGRVRKAVYLPNSN